MSTIFRVLHVDDDPFYAAIIRRVLEQAGFNVSYAPHGEAGLHEARERQPDLILLDIKMPKKNGFETLEDLKAESRTARIPVMMLTNLSAKEDIQVCFDHGAVEYFIKTQHTPEDVCRILCRFFASSVCSRQCVAPSCTRRCVAPPSVCAT